MTSKSDLFPVALPFLFEDSGRGIRPLVWL